MSLEKRQLEEARCLIRALTDFLESADVPPEDDLKVADLLKRGEAWLAWHTGSTALRGFQRFPKSARTRRATS